MLYQWCINVARTYVALIYCLVNFKLCPVLFRSAKVVNKDERQVENGVILKSQKWLDTAWWAIGAILFVSVSSILGQHQALTLTYETQTKYPQQVKQILRDGFFVRFLVGFTTGKKDIFPHVQTITSPVRPHYHLYLTRYPVMAPVADAEQQNTMTMTYFCKVRVTS